MSNPLDKYSRGKLLGSGSYGTATLFTTRDGKKVVIKEIDLKAMSPSDVKAAEGEVKVRLVSMPAKQQRMVCCPAPSRPVAGRQLSTGCYTLSCTSLGQSLVHTLCLGVQVLQMLHNSNIVSCIESFRHQGKLCIVMDYCSEGEPFFLNTAAIAHCWCSVS